MRSKGSDVPLIKGCWYICQHKSFDQNSTVTAECMGFDEDIVLMRYREDAEFFRWIRAIPHSYVRAIHRDPRWFPRLFMLYGRLVHGLDFI